MTSVLSEDILRHPRWRPWITAAKVLLCAAVIAAVTWALVGQFRKVQWSQVRFELAPTILGIVALLGVSFMQLAARWTLLMAYGYPLNWRIQVPAAWVPQLGKYLPGGVASVAGVVYILRRYNVPGAVALSAAVLLDGLAVIAGLIVSTPLLLWGPVRERMPSAWIFAVVLTVIGLFIIHPRVFVAMLNWMMRKLGRQPIPAAPPVAKYIWPVLASFAQWLFAGMALWLMTLALTPVSAGLIPLFIASAALAMTLSYLMPFAPGGIGIREGLYLLTIGPAIGPAAAIVVLAMRVLQTLIEIGLAAVGVVVLRKAG
jgi:hypothetical protein